MTNAAASESSASSATESAYGIAPMPREEPSDHEGGSTRQGDRAKAGALRRDMEGTAAHHIK